MTADPVRRILIWMVPVTAGAMGVAALVIGAQSAARTGRATEPYLADAWIALVYPVVGAWLVTTGRRRAAGAVMLSAILIALTGLCVAWSEFAAIEAHTVPGAQLAAFLATWTWTPYLLLPTALPLLYVRHRTVPRLTLILLVAAVAMTALTAIVSSAVPVWISVDDGATNPGMAALAAVAAFLPGLVLLGISPLVIVALVRDRLLGRGEGTTAALVGAAGFWGAAVTAGFFPYPWNDVWTAVGASLLPAALVVDQYLHGLQEAEQERWRQMVATRDAERGRVRQELHDGVGPRLAGLGLRLDGLQDVVTGDLRREIGEVREQLGEAVTEVRRIVEGLAPRALDELGLVGSIRACAETVAPGRVDVNAVDLPRMQPEVEMAAYRIVTEALMNAVRHGDAQRISVTVSTETQWLRVIVADDGGGGAAPRQGGLGIPGMSARAEALGGRVEVAERQPQGTVVETLLPREGRR